MDGVAKLASEEREALFNETAARLGFHPVVAEKDFWVCWTLHHLFSLEGLPTLLFKGGTSLSKAFNLIQRFSEDIDLAMDRADLGFQGGNDPLAIERTNARRRKLKELAAKCQEVAHDSLLPKLEKSLRLVLGEDRRWSLEAENLPDGQIDIRFAYPPSLHEQYGEIGYIKPSVKIELGARSDQQPSERATFRSYAAQEFPDYFENPDVSALVLSPIRTFWEKATILHSVNHRVLAGERSEALSRELSRHAYDIAKIARSDIGPRAIGDLDILGEVTRHKSVFFSSRKCRYDLAVPGSFRLYPIAELERGLGADYREMSPMFFGETLTFQEILVELRRAEDAINSRG